jgi:hypothetical protein
MEDVWIDRDVYLRNWLMELFGTGTSEIYLSGGQDSKLKNFQ